MPNKKSLTVLIGISGILLSTITMAASSNSLSKDEWLTAFKELVPSKICKRLVDDPDTKKLLENANINYDKCVILVPVSFDKCQTKFYSKIPKNINDKSASTWGQTLGNCIGADFFSNNLAANPGNSTTTPTAGTSSTATHLDNITKEEWLNDLTIIFPKLICGKLLEDPSLHKKLTKYGITSDKCLSLMPDSVAACEKKFSSKMPMTLDKRNQDKWSKPLGRCIGEDFAKKNLR